MHRVGFTTLHALHRNPRSYPLHELFNPPPSRHTESSCSKTSPYDANPVDYYSMTSRQMGYNPWSFDYDVDRYCSRFLSPFLSVILFSIVLFAINYCSILRRENITLFFTIFWYLRLDIFFTRNFWTKNLLKSGRHLKKYKEKRSTSIFHHLLFIRKCWQKIDSKLSKVFANKRNLVLWELLGCVMQTLCVARIFSLARVYASHFLSHTDPASGKLRVIDQHASLSFVIPLQRL